MTTLSFYPHWVGVCIAFFLLFSLSTGGIFAQQNLPVIKATGTNVKIKDGYVIREGIWSLSPETRQDVYNVLRPDFDHQVTFHTGTDSISFLVAPGNQYDFVVLLNGKDSCFTRISAASSDSIKDVGIGNEALVSPEMQAMDFVVFRDYLQNEHPGYTAISPGKV